MTFKMTGLGSGFDIDQIVKAYVDAEKVPQEVIIKNKRTKLESQLSAFGQLESKVALLDQTLQRLSEPDLYAGKNYQIENTDYFTPTVHNNTYIGVRDIVIETVAQPHTLATPPRVYFKYPALPNSPTDPIAEEPESCTPEMALGARGSLTVKVDGMGQTIDIIPEMSLLDIARKIDEAALDTPYAQSSLIFASEGTQLVLASEALGEKHKLSIDIEDEDLQGDAVLTQLFGDPTQLNPPLTYDPKTATEPSLYGIRELKAATDAELTIDGLRFKESTNTLIDIIPGLDLELHKAHNPIDPPTRMSIYVDQTELLQLIYQFVDQHNATTETIKEHSFFGVTENTRGPLVGDYLVSSLKRDLEMRGQLSPDGLSLGLIGINYTQEGTLEINEQILTTALTNEKLDLKSLFIDEGYGMAVNMQKKTEAFIKIDGSFDAREDSINQTLEELVEQKEKLDTLMEAREAILYKKFNLMDEIMNRMEKTREHLKNLFDTLPGVGNSKKD